MTKSDLSSQASAAMPLLTLRAAGSSDLDAINRLMDESRAYDGQYRAILEGYRVTAKMIERDRYTVVALENEIIGFTALTKEAEPELDLMFVAESAQGSGVGRLLIAELKAYSKAIGAKAIRITSHSPSEGFYRSVGARRIGTMPPSGRIAWSRPMLRLSLDGVDDGD